MYTFHLIYQSVRCVSRYIYMQYFTLFYSFLYILALLIFRKNYTFLFRKPIDRSACVSQRRAALRRIVLRSRDYRFIDLILRGQVSSGFRSAALADLTFVFSQ